MENWNGKRVTEEHIIFVKERIRRKFPGIYVEKINTFYNITVVQAVNLTIELNGLGADKFSLIIDIWRDALICHNELTSIYSPIDHYYCIV